MVKQQNPADKYHLMPYAEFMATEYPPINWLVEGLIPNPGITIFSANPNNYKTFTTQHLAMSICTGEKVFGHFEVKSPGPVVLINEEDPGGLVQNRIKILQNPEEALPHDLHLMSQVDFVLTAENSKWLLDQCIAIGARALILDSFTRIGNLKDENASTESNAVFSLLKPFVAIGVSVIMTHHHSKKATEDLSLSLRGSSDIAAFIDCHIAMKKQDDETILFTTTKLRAGAIPPPFTVIVETDNTSYIRFPFVGQAEKKTKSAEAREMILAIISLSDKPMFQSQIFETMFLQGYDGGRKTFETTIRKMAESGEIHRKRGSGNKYFYYIGEETAIEETGVAKDLFSM